MSQFRQFWIKDFVVFKTHERYADGASVREAYDNPAPNGKIHVIEYSALEAAQKEIEQLKLIFSVQLDILEQNKQLTSALKVAEDALEKYKDSAFDIDGKVYKVGSKAAEALAKIQKIKKGLE